MDTKIADAISKAADEVIDGSLYEEHFPLGNLPHVDLGGMTGGNQMCLFSLKLFGRLAPARRAT